MPTDDLSHDEHALPEVAPPPDVLRRLFLGDDGLRAGWSIALYVLVLVALSVAVNAIIGHLHLLPAPPPRGTPRPEPGPRATAIGTWGNFGLLALAALVLSRIERRPFACYGLALKRALPDLATGLFWGFTMLSALIGMLLATHAIAFEGLLLHGATAFAYAAKWALVFLAVGFFEEFLFRGYLQYTAARGIAGLVRALDPANRRAHLIGFWAAAFLFSVLLFASAHLGNGGETALGLTSVALVGIVFAFALYRTGTLWWLIGFHMAWDWAQSYFYGTPDSGHVSVGRLLSSHPTGSVLLSGGTAGPEGSLLILPTLALTALVIHLTLPRRDYPLTPDQRPGPAAPSVYT